ncbi:MAG: BlaI/MecI/CopY family transcriptional regulator [Candidatus Hydrogenedentales bacterium]|jgi:predicted transcriptional regulator
MSGKSVDQLGSLQRVVMEIVWGLGEASVHQVIERMPRDKNPAYTTILTVMQNLEKSGWLKHRQDGRSYIYQPVVTRDQLEWRSIRQSVKSLFKGDVGAFMQHLICEEDLSDKDLAELRQMIDKRRKERGNG